MITSQLKALLQARPFESFCLSLADGRDLNVHDRFDITFAYSSSHTAREGPIAVAVAEHFLIEPPP